MRVELFEVRFNNCNSIYMAGQTVTGSVILKLSKATWIDTICIKFSGRARARWDVSKGDDSKRYQADEIYIDSEYCLYRSRNRVDKHPIGMHVYPFDFALPADVPSSFEGRRGFVRYQCLVMLDMGWKGMMDIEQDLTVIRHLDLSTVPGAALPQNLEEEEMYEGCCCDSGSVAAYLRLQKSGFVSGEPMNYDIIINNQATSSIYGISLALIQTVRYTGYSDSFFSSGNAKYHDKVNNFTLYQSDDEIGPRKCISHNSHCIIPAVAPSLLEGCSIINITYEVILEVPVGWRTIYLSCEVFIGTIPLRRSEPRPPSGTNANASLEVDLSEPPVRQNFDFPPSYEECVFGRMESQEGNDDADENDDDNGAHTNHGDGQARPTSSAGSRRSRLHRLPSYPYYSTDHFTSGGTYVSELRTDQPVPATDHFTSGNTYVNVPASEQPAPVTTPTSHPLPLSFSPAHPTHGDYTPLATAEEDDNISSLPPPPSYDSLQH